MVMIRFFKELYLTGFTLGFRFRIGPGWGSGMAANMNAGKGVAFIALIEGVILMQVAAWIEIDLGTRFLFTTDKWADGIAFLALYFANYYALVTCGHGITFEREFNKLNKSRKILLLASFAGMMMLTLIFVIYSVSVYHHFFHIIPKG